MELVLFLLIPLSSIGLLFLKDAKSQRKQVMNVLLILNAVLFLSPLIMAYLETPSGENMWSDNSGGGAFLWLYLIVLPICAIIQLVLLVLKINFAINSK
jgi:hypothetical protein